MKTKLSLAMAILFSLGVTACSGGTSTGTIPQQIQAGKPIEDKTAEVEALKQQLSDSEKEREAAQQKLQELQSQREAEQQQAAIKEKATNYIVGDTTLNKDELAKALETGSALQQQAAAEGKNINTLIGKSVESGSLLTTTTNAYAGYAVVRENYSDDAPINRYIAVAKTATTDNANVVDATYKGKAIMTTMNMPSVLENTNQNTAMYELTLNVKDSTVSGGITNTNETIAAKRAELGQAADIISFNNAEIKVTDDVVGFNGTATFNYGHGFMPNATGDGKGTYQGVFAGEKAEGVVGTFKTDSTAKDSSVQGAFLGERQ